MPDTTHNVPIPDTDHDADVRIPDGADGVVVVVHDGEADWHGSEVQTIVDALHRTGFGTVVANLHPREDQARRFALTIVTDGLLSTVDWATSKLTERPVGLLVEGIGAAAALTVAATRPDSVAAIVCVGGHTELAREPMDLVGAPTLLLVGEADEPVLELNRQTARAVPGIAEVRLLSDTGRDAGEVATEAAAWFGREMGTAVQRVPGDQEIHEIGD